MKILITMAGRGSRFQDVGVEEPKHEIPVKGKPMFDWATLSLSSFFDDEFIFVTQKEHNPTPFLNEACSRMGIKQYHEVQLNEYTKGQASTALAANQLLHKHDSVAIYNIDTYIESYEITKNEVDGDGFIPTFKTQGERWSFVRMNDLGHAVEVSEKNKISDHATVGFYYFDQWGDFTDAYDARASTVEDTYGETYVAPLYNYLIEESKIVRTYEIDSDSIHVIGTPEDLCEFDPEFNRGLEGE